jgi:hypothetical protein
MFSDQISKATFDTVPEIHCTINDEYDEVRTNPFAGIALWKLVTTLYVGSDVLRRDALREQLLNAIHCPLVRAKDVPDWLNNVRNIFKEFVQAHGNSNSSYIIADDLVMARSLTLLTQRELLKSRTLLIGPKSLKLPRASEISGRPARSLGSNSIPCMIKSPIRQTLSSAGFNPATTSWTPMGPQQLTSQGCPEASGA